MAKEPLKLCPITESLETVHYGLSFLMLMLQHEKGWPVNGSKAANTAILCESIPCIMFGHLGDILCVFVAPAIQLTSSTPK